MAFFDEIAKRQGQMIKFTSVTTGKSVEYPAFVTSFSDAFTVNWSGGGVSFGRSDPVKSYQSTTRRINASFDILGRSKEVAIENFKKYSALIKMMYPLYSAPLANQKNARTILAGPLMRIKYSNYISSPKSADGLLGCISGVDFKPDYDGGHFLVGPEKNMVPIKYSLGFVFEPLHEEILGEDPTGEFLNGKFPYNLDSASGNQSVTVDASDINALGGRDR